ncbi:DUF3662 domain-containing protein [Chloroflexales bacterium ZM16-3]|nr:DUF3662 domain-containing protein [Chloroflexales bacterium ZM16-3]
MSALSRFEQLMEQMVEGSVARLFRSPVQPVEIARRLERAMESQQSISVKRVIVPSFYRAYLNPQDFTAFQPVRAQLEQEMATYLSDLAAERGFTMLEHPRVALAEDPAVPRRGIQVVAELVNTPAAETTQVMSATTAQAAPVRRGHAMLLLQTSAGPQPIPVESTTATIGRGLGNDIILEDTRVSRHHAQLRYKARRFWLTDLNSTNGTFINGARVNETALRDGDVVSLGGLELTFKEG